MLLKFLSFSALILLTSCGSDKKEEPPIPPISSFLNWEEQTPLAIETVSDLSVMSQNSERSEVAPDFFKGEALMSRDERDNVQNGYIYPLYFATRNQDFPSRQWTDGFTVQKSNPSDETEARKVQEIRADLMAFFDQNTLVGLFFGLSQYKLIDIRHYSFKVSPPNVVETCFTIRFERQKRGTINFCYDGHRYLKQEDGTFPKVRYDYQTGSNDGGFFLTFGSGNSGNLLESQTFQLFALSIAAYEVMFDNIENRNLRDFFITYEPLATQMTKANDAYSGTFNFVLENKNYLDGRQ